MSVRVEVRFEPASLVRANDGLDLGALSGRYGAAIEAALAGELPGTAITVVADPSIRGVRATIEGIEGPEARALERTVLDVCGVLRETMAYA